jgi:hypothetical protein
MVDLLPSSNTVPASVPDSQVPAEKVETATARQREVSRSRLFLQGPLPLSWIREHINNPADRLLLILVAHSDMRRSAEVKLTGGMLADAGIGDRKAGYRALGKLESRGVIAVTRKRGMRPIVRILAHPGRWRGGGQWAANGWEPCPPGVDVPSQGAPGVNIRRYRGRQSRRPPADPS